LKKNALIEANEVLISERQKNNENDRYEKSLERNNFFPYTHGDLIEKQRIVLSEL
jgi:hypothetical protein